MMGEKSKVVLLTVNNNDKLVGALKLEKENNPENLIIALVKMGNSVSLPTDIYEYADVVFTDLESDLDEVQRIMDNLINGSNLMPIEAEDIYNLFSCANRPIKMARCLVKNPADIQGLVDIIAKEKEITNIAVFFVGKEENISVDSIMEAGDQIAEQISPEANCLMCAIIVDDVEDDVQFVIDVMY